MNLILNSTSTALWHEVIQDAEAACAVRLKEDLESYLVSLLVRFTNKPEIIKHIMATDFLEGAAQVGASQRLAALREVGDKCLLFSGLFPHMAAKRLVKINYFVGIGTTAYSAISVARNDIFHLLSQQFVKLMDILQALRCYSSQYPDLLPLEAYDLWNETGSKRALNVLNQYRIKR